MRIDKYLADMGAGTRGELRKSIRKNGVRIGGELIFDPGYLLKEDGASDVFPEVIYQGELWQYETVVWYMLNKPAGVLSASEDRKQKTVLDLITERKRTDLFPVGRLDKDTEGLLLLQMTATWRIAFWRRNFMWTKHTLSGRPAVLLPGRMRRGLRRESGTMSI